MARGKNKGRLQVDVTAQLSVLSKIYRPHDGKVNANHKTQPAKSMKSSDKPIKMTLPTLENLLGFPVILLVPTQSFLSAENSPRHIALALCVLRGKLRGQPSRHV